MQLPNYKYITGQVLEIAPTSGWTDGTLLQDIYPDSSFVSGNNQDSMQMKPEIKNRKVYAKYSFAKRFEGGPGLVHGGILSAVLDDIRDHLLPMIPEVDLFSRASLQEPLLKCLFSKGSPNSLF